jgi:dsRNA-specific ribonuclease
MNFSEFIKNLIYGFRLDSEFASVLVDSYSLKLYQKAFTHVSFSVSNNYEVYEQLGDITLNKFLVWYFHERFPDFNNTFGVKIVARLRIKYGSKQFLSELAEKLGFWNWIRHNENLTSVGKKISLLEDVFESFIGVSEFILDHRFSPGVGYIVCRKILKRIFDPIPIDIHYNSLFDAKTRLKELFDLKKDTLGVLKYEYIRNEEGSKIEIFRVLNECRIFISSGVSTINKSEAEQKASEQALYILAEQGFCKDIPTEYKNLLVRMN